MEMVLMRMNSGPIGAFRQTCERGQRAGSCNNPDEKWQSCDREVQWCGGGKGWAQAAASAAEVGVCRQGKVIDLGLKRSGTVSTH